MAWTAPGDLPILADCQQTPTATPSAVTRTPTATVTAPQTETVTGMPTTTETPTSPTSTATPSATATATGTVPTRTPTVTASRTPTAWPTPTLTRTSTERPSVTPTATAIEIAVSMPGTHFGQGDECALDLAVQNPGAAQDVDLYVLLDVLGSYWCYPSWQPLSAGLDWQQLTVAARMNETLPLIPPFTMPAVSPLEPLYFYAAMFEPGYLDLDHVASNGAVWMFALGD